MNEMITSSAEPQELGMGHFWQDLAAGQRFKTFKRTVTEADLLSFISSTGMLEVIFIDASFEGAISGRPVPGMLTLGLIEGIQFQTLIQRTGLAMLEMNVTALAPVRVNDTISAIIEILDVKPTSSRNRAVVTSRVDVSNQRDEAVLSYTVKRLVQGHPEA